MKRPPDRKLVLAVAVLLVAASAMFARSAEQKSDYHTVNHVILGGR